VLGVEAAGAVPAAPLRPVQGGVGELDQGRGVLGVVRVERDPGRAGELDPADFHRADGGSGPLGDRKRVPARDADQDQAELVATGARRDVGGPDRAPQGRAGRAEHLVAERVSVGVVDLLEAVDVKRHQRDRRPHGSGPIELERQRLVEGAVVRQSGQRVGCRHTRQPRVL
jgi:hypothetical protein